MYVKLHIQSREIKKVDLLPCCASLIIKDLKEPIRQRRKIKGSIHKHSGNLTFEQVKTIAKKMREKSLARDMAGTVKEVLGTW